MKIGKKTVSRVLEKMGTAARLKLIIAKTPEVMEVLISGMSSKDKRKLMEGTTPGMMDQLLSDMTTEDKQKLVESLFPVMMKHLNLEQMMPTAVAHAITRDKGAVGPLAGVRKIAGRAARS